MSVTVCILKESGQSVCHSSDLSSQYVSTGRLRTGRTGRKEEQTKRAIAGSKYIGWAGDCTFLLSLSKFCFQNPIYCSHTQNFNLLFYCGETSTDLMINNIFYFSKIQKLSWYTSCCLDFGRLESRRARISQCVRQAVWLGGVIEYFRPVGKT